MSDNGGRVAYHLRVKKTIERQIFIDLLYRINSFKNIYNYKYISFGGPFLEDFKLMHGHFGIQKMISLEIDQEVIKRQKFNSPLSENCICLKHTSSGEFIEKELEKIKKKVIFWLDYAESKDTREQLWEFMDVLKKIKNHSIVKITLNAEPKNLYSDENYLDELCNNSNFYNEMKEKPDETENFKRKQRYIELKNRLQKIGIFPANVTEKDWISKDPFDIYPEVLFKSVIIAAFLALQGKKDLVFLPLTSFKYADGQQMFTFTGILLPKNKKENFLKKTGLNNYIMYINNKGDNERPMHIKTDSISVLEKSHFDSFLPFPNNNNDIGSIFKNSEWLKNSKDAEKMFKNYLEFYRYYPNFAKITF